MMAEEVASESCKVFLKGLPPNVTKSTITNAFTEFGTVSDVIFKYTQYGNKIKGLGYVIFEAQESADACLTKQAVTIKDKKVEVKKARDGDKHTAEEESLESIPIEALKCFICKRDNFPTVRVYLNHRKGKQHQAVLKVFKTKSAAVLQLLRAEAKLAADRCFDKTWMNKSTKDAPTTCLVCQCHLSCNPETHEKSMEHKMVVSYNNQKCCDIQFSERSKYEIHLLSLKHLKNMYAKENKNEDEETRLTMKRAIDIYKQCDSDLRELKDSYPLLDLADELPDYDPNTPLGVHFVVKKINYHCMCCDQKFFPQVNFIEPHCRSYDHYSNMTDYISSLEQKNAKKRKNRDDDDGKPGKKPLFCISGDTFIMKGEKKTEADEKETSPVKSVSVKVKNEIIKKEVDKEKEDPVQKSDDVENVGEDDDAKNLEEQTEVVDEQDPKVAEEEEEEEVEAMEEQEDEGMEDEEAEVENEDEGDGEVEEYDDAEEVQEVDNEEEEEEEVQEVYDVEDQEDDQSAEENSSEIPTKDAESEEEEVMEVEEVAPSRPVVRGRRGRGRGRALKR